MEAIVREYILSRKLYLEGELKRCGESLDEFMSDPNIAHYRREIGVLHGEIDSYADELEALKRFEKRLEGGKEEMTNGEMFAMVFGFRTKQFCVSPCGFHCGDGDCDCCPYYNWLKKPYEGRRDEDGEAEYCAKFPSARTE